MHAIRPYCLNLKNWVCSSLVFVIIFWCEMMDEVHGRGFTCEGPSTTSTCYMGVFSFFNNLFPSLDLASFSPRSRERLVSRWTHNTTDAISSVAFLPPKQRQNIVARNHELRFCTKHIQATRLARISGGNDTLSHAWHSKLERQKHKKGSQGCPAASCWDHPCFISPSRTTKRAHTARGYGTEAQHSTAQHSGTGLPTSRQYFNVTLPFRSLTALGEGHHCRAPNRPPTGRRYGAQGRARPTPI